MNLTPRQLIEQINAVSDEFFALSQEAATIAERKGPVWLEIKHENTMKSLTNAETDKVWEASADGRREAYLKIYLRGLQAKRGALILEHKMNQGIV